MPKKPSSRLERQSPTHDGVTHNTRQLKAGKRRVFALATQMPGVHSPGGGRVKHTNVRHSTHHQTPSAGRLWPQGITQYPDGATADSGQGLRQAQAVLSSPFERQAQQQLDAGGASLALRKGQSFGVVIHGCVV